MEITVADQTKIFLFACLLGVVLSGIYDIFRVIRIAVPHGKAAIFTEDMLFFCICTIFSFIFLLKTTDGQIRFFILLGEGLGWLLHHCTLGELIIRISGAIIKAVKAILHFLYKWIIRPIGHFFGLLFTKLHKVFNFFKGKAKKTSKKQKYSLKRSRVVLYNLIKHKPKKIKDVNKEREGSESHEEPKREKQRCSKSKKQKKLAV